MKTDYLKKSSWRWWHVIFTQETKHQRLGGTPEQTAYSQAKLKLMEVKQALKKKKEESLQGPKEQTPQKQEKNNKKENSLSDIARTKTIKDKFIPEI